MLNIKDLSKAIRQVSEEKGLPEEVVINAIESAVAIAYKKEYGEKGEIIKAELDTKTGAIKFWKIKIVVDKNAIRFPDNNVEKTKEENKSSEESENKKIYVYNPNKHILLDEAKKIKPDVKVGEELMFPAEDHDEFGRIAAQVAKQAIIQRLRESERKSILKEWSGKEGAVVSGVVQRFERGNVYVDLGRTSGIMFANESMPGEHYRSGERLRFLVLAVQEDTRMPGIILSRAHPDFVAKLFEAEVPEISEGVVEIKCIAREPGSRTKIAVSSNMEEVDPVGALVGQRGTRVMVVNNELGQEKIDIIEWSDDPKEFIENALSPAKVHSVEILPRREARIYVPEDQLSLAIGRGGQNVRLAARLTSWKLDVRSQTRPDVVQEKGVAEAPQKETTADHTAETDNISGNENNENTAIRDEELKQREQNDKSEKSNDDTDGENDSEDNNNNEK